VSYCSLSDKSISYNKVILNFITVVKRAGNLHFKNSGIQSFGPDVFNTHTIMVR